MGRKKSMAVGRVSQIWKKAHRAEYPSRQTWSVLDYSDAMEFGEVVDALLSWPMPGAHSARPRL
jgi:hypothetical protein